MLIDEKRLKKFAGPGSWERGISYYSKKRVNLLKVTPNQIHSTVSGTYIYEVFLYKYNDGWRARCDCPYDYGGTCKHIIATGLAANEFYGRVEEANLKIKKQQSLFDKFELNTQIPAQRNVYDKQLVFKFFRDELKWHLLPVFRYIRKDGKLGRETAASFYLLKNEVRANSKEKIALRYLDDYRYSYTYDKTLTPQFEYGTDLGHVLKMLGESIIIDSQDGEQLKFYPGSLTLKFYLNPQDKSSAKEGYYLTAVLFDGDNQFGLLDNSFTLLTSGYVFLLKDNTLYELANPLKAQFLTPFLKEDKITVSPEETDQFLEKIYPELSSNGNTCVLPQGFLSHAHQDLTAKQLFLNEKQDLLTMEVKFLYGNEISVNHFDKRETLIVKQDNNFVKVTRQLSSEKQWVNKLYDYSLSQHEQELKLSAKKDPIDWLFNELPQIAALGFDIFGEEKLDKLKVQRAEPKIITKVTSNRDWFDLEMELDFDGIRVSAEEVLNLIKNQKNYIRLNNGYTIRIDDSILMKLGLAGTFGQKTGKTEHTRRFSKNQIFMLDQILNLSDEKKTDQLFNNQLKKLKSFTGIKTVEVPKAFNGQLREYQKTGYYWLHFLKEYGFGGCLADDMGLGKTAQTLSFILSLKKQTPEPVLIVAPTSVIFNWAQEIEKFTPGISYYQHYGPERQDNLDNLKDTDVIITSYSLLWRDKEMFLKKLFFYLILDESQKIKNPLALTSKVAFKMKAHNRLVLTGTPLENNLSELWSQFNFINPGMLGSLKSFQDYFGRAIEQEGDAGKAEKLKKIIYPFILRRKKEQVIKELPPKIETVTYCDMTEKQKKVYEKWRDYYRAAILEQIDEEGLNKSKIKVLEGLTRLRQISIHPGLVEKTNQKMTSGKMEALMESLQEIISENHKVLVFSQFVKALSLVREHFAKENIHYAYLDGSTKQRSEQIDKFQHDDNCPVFLISLKAGGTGLNLTKASYVFHLDPWWNPAVEMQASDRAHRIGQTKQVFVYKMITKESVEEKILLLQEEKRRLADEIISTDSAFFKTLNKEDIENLFI